MSLLHLPVFGILERIQGGIYVRGKHLPQVSTAVFPAQVQCCNATQRVLILAK